MMGLTRKFWGPAIVTAALALGGCAETQIAVHAAKQVSKRVAAPAPEAAPVPGPGVYKVGEPYDVAGVWYYPKADPDYDETGVASWYGEPFHGKPTANGERYDMNAITAAHKTLPLPTYVRVTNLDNGRSLIIRLNDRGPFVHGRIIDLSRRAAQLLGFERKGTARVRVQAVGGPGGETIVAKPVTPEEERTAIAAVPRESVSSERLPPPEGVAAAPGPEPPPARAAPAPARAEPAPATRTAAVTIVPVEPTRLFVQAGAFSFYDNARRLGAKLSGMGPTVISPVTIKGQRLFRVRIGPLDTLGLADATLERLIRGGYPGARIVVD